MPCEFEVVALRAAAVEGGEEYVLEPEEAEDLRLRDLGLDWKADLVLL